MEEKQKKVQSLAKRRGFIFQNSEIYGGLVSVYDYGPTGVELLKNIRALWWEHFVHSDPDIVGIESSIFMHPKVWKASGHVGGFNEGLVECRSCNYRFRADHLVEDHTEDIDADHYDNKGLQKLIEENKINCPHCGKYDWSEIKEFNQMFKTKLGSSKVDQMDVYLRPETAQGMFVDFRQVMNSTRKQIPFGIAQQGKAFRNEITKGKYIFRTLEFEQMEIEYFIKEEKWKKTWDMWRKKIEVWYNEVLGVSKDKFIWKPHHPDKLSHYAKKAEDYEYKFGFGHGEVSGLHYRTDFDLKTHEKYSGNNMKARDPKTNEEYEPHVMEATFGLNRNLYMILYDSYREDGDRKYLSLPIKLAPYKAAVFPLLSNKEELVEKARTIYNKLNSKYHISWDDRGNIGKRYYSQDEIGTPYCITVDFDTLKDDTVTIRDRDTTEQKRVKIAELQELIKKENES